MSGIDRTGSCKLRRATKHLASIPLAVPITCAALVLLFSVADAALCVNDAMCHGNCKITNPTYYYAQLQPTLDVSASGIPGTPTTATPYMISASTSVTEEFGTYYTSGAYPTYLYVVCKSG